MFSSISSSIFVIESWTMIFTVKNMILTTFQSTLLLGELEPMYRIKTTTVRHSASLDLQRGPGWPRGSWMTIWILIPLQWKWLLGTARELASWLFVTMPMNSIVGIDHKSWLLWSPALLRSGLKRLSYWFLRRHMTVMEWKSLLQSGNSHPQWV